MAIGMLLPATLGAQFQDPVPAGDPTKTAGDFALGLDYFENVNLVYEEDGAIVLETIVGGTGLATPLGIGKQPDLAPGSLGTFVCFSAPGPLAAEDHDVFLASRMGGTPTLPVNFSLSPGQDLRPRLAVSEKGSPVIAWAKQGTDSESHVWVRRQGRAGVDLGPGDAPVLVIDRLGRVHVVYRLEGDIAHVQETSSDQPDLFGSPRFVTRTPGVVESEPSCAMSQGRTLFVVYERGGEIFLSQDAGGDFTESARIAGGGASNPHCAVSATGAMAIVFARAGDIYWVLGTTFFLPGPELAWETPSVESAPKVAVDAFANVFVAFRRDGRLYHATSAGTPQARFRASPIQGPLPLDVSFVDESTGAVTGWDWDFGDGSGSRDRNPVHVYERTGSFEVSLSVTGPGGTSPIIHRETVQVIDPLNEMHLGRVDAFPGQTGVHVPVIASHDEPAQGFTVAAVYDPAILTVETLKFEFSNIEYLEPELFAVNISRDPADPFVTAGMLFDVSIPFEGKVLPAGRNYRIANVVVTVDPKATPGTRTHLELRNSVGQPPVNNIITVGGFTVLPLLGEGGWIRISHLEFPPPRFFVRADSDANGVVNLTDAVATLNQLFSGAGLSTCEDAMDSTDDGRVDISDAVYTLSFLFKSGRFPAPPWPDWGLDPTDDTLAPCLLR